MILIRVKLEATINSLLENALPNDFQKFKIFKHLVRYYDYQDDYFTFNSKLFEFYLIPRKKRCDKAAHKIFKIKITPYDYQLLALGFHNSVIQHHDIFSKATNVKWLITENFKLPPEITTAEIFFASIVYFSKPSNENNFVIECEDFLESWKQVCFTRFGNKYTKYIETLEPKLAKKKSNFEIDIQALGGSDAGNTVLLTQAQLHWIKDILKCLSEGTHLKPHPGVIAVEHPKLRHLDYHVNAYNKLFSSVNSTVNQQRQRLADSLAAICNELLVADRKENVWNVTTKSRES